ncbi:virion structural protein [Myxococcus phage Mx8]|uniref:p54 n=1 Tax=Myxococcus phage Mx8 TaxID=49964 RepID=Q94MR5_9CAUD|nr:virion structural protein [Myxococcus phage Mx8]AAK94389.1 p54 [Myxococcus phage Mx8]
MGKQAPAPPDFRGAAEQQSQASQQSINQQTQANRPNINTPWASQQWTQGPNGSWGMQTSFNGPLGDASNAVQQQLATSLSQPLDFSGLPGVSSGDAARNQAIESAYSQATSRLDPQWQRREDAERTRLLNQGLSEGSEAYRNAQSEFGQQRNDAYTSAMASAIGQGTAAGQAVFNQDMAARQNAMAELLRQRGQPMAEAQALQGFLSMPGFNNAGAYSPTDYLGAAMGQHNANMGQWQASNQANADVFGGLMNVASTLPFFLSDERMKKDIRRLPTEVMSGVHLATWEYLHEPGRRYLGVVAQDVAAVAPHLVRTGPGGMLLVHPIFAPEPLS